MPQKTPAPTPGSGRHVRRWLSLFYALPVLFILGLCGAMAYRSATHQKPPVRTISAAPFATVKINGLDARLFTQGDALRASGNDLFIEFRDAQGKLADVGEVSFQLELKMPGSIMHSIGKPMRGATPGQYRTNLQPSLAGEWTATLGFAGPLGKGEASFSVKVM
jgi:hypothetical protein